MKIGFDISDLATDRADGTTRYTAELAKRLPQLMSQDQWLYFSPGEIPAVYKLQAANVQVIRSDWPKYWTQSRLPWDLYRYRPNVLFMPIQQLPWLRPKKMRTVAVIHDIAFHFYPEQFTYKDWALQHVFTAAAVRSADAIIAVSHATAEDVAMMYGRRTGVQVVHHGVDHEFFRTPTEAEQATAWQQLTEAYARLKKPYLLFVGQIQPRKNLERLVEAFEGIAGQDKNVQLAIAGGHGWLNQSIYARVATSVYKDRIIMLGRVPNQQLRFLYWQAEAYILPSLYEGFGMPIVEAMACGCPVVTSNVSSMPEVAGQAAVLVNPNSVASIVQGFEEVRRKRDYYREAGIKRAAEFSWSRTAQQTELVIRSVQ